MQRTERMPRKPRRPFRSHALILCALMLAGCANGDFGEVHDYLVADSIHDWVGRDTVPKPSTFEYTDDERALRDHAYPLIEPPYERQRWYSIAGEYGLIRPSLRGDRVAYANHLMSASYRSPSSRYAQLIDDIRNDSARITPFFEVAGRMSRRWPMRRNMPCGASKKTPTSSTSCGQAWASVRPPTASRSSGW
jgi:hypothetical protein